MADRAWPDGLDAELRDILGYQCFQLGAFAHLYQDAGEFDAPGDVAPMQKRAEDEQAFMLHLWIGYWFKHGAEWRHHATADLRRVKAKAERLTWQRSNTIPRGVDFDIRVRLVESQAPQPLKLREVRACWWRNWEDADTAAKERWCWREVDELGNAGEPIVEANVRWWLRA